MKKRIEVVVFLIITLVVVVAITSYLGTDFGFVDIDIDNRKSENNLKDLSNLEDLTSTKPRSVTSSDKATDESFNKSPYEGLTEVQKKYFSTGFTAGIENILFFGKVVDQYDNPVIGAEVPFCTSGRYLASGRGCSMVLTDENGRFLIDSKGGGLTLNLIIHPDIDFSYPKPHYGGRLNAKTRQMTFWGYQHNKGGNDPLWTDTSLKSPYVFKAWRITTSELINSGRINTYIKANNSIHTINFDKKKRYRVTAAEEDGHLHISCSKKSKNADWNIEINPVAGGIQHTNDNYLNKAPDKNYHERIQIKYNGSDKDYRDSLMHQRYYFTAKNEKVFGSLFVNYEPFVKKEKCRITMEYKINSNGSRILVGRK